MDHKFFSPSEKNKKPIRGGVCVNKGMLEPTRLEPTRPQSDKGVTGLRAGCLRYSRHTLPAGLRRKLFIIARERARGVDSQMTLMCREGCITQQLTRPRARSCPPRARNILQVCFVSATWYGKKVEAVFLARTGILTNVLVCGNRLSNLDQSDLGGRANKKARQESGELFV